MMRIYLGTLNHLLSVDFGERESDGAVYVGIHVEEHSGVPGDLIAFRIPAESIEEFRKGLIKYAEKEKAGEKT